MPRVKTFNLEVSQERIDESTPNNSRHCLVADVVRELIPNSYSIAVRDGWVNFNIGDHKEVTGTRYAFPLPGSALDAQRLLDDGRKSEIKPFKFALDGREGFSKPVEKRGPAAKPYKRRKKKAVRRKTGARRCPVRRYRGLSTISKAKAA